MRGKLCTMLLGGLISALGPCVARADSPLIDEKVFNQMKQAYGEDCGAVAGCVVLGLLGREAPSLPDMLKAMRDTPAGGISMASLKRDMEKRGLYATGCEFTDRSLLLTMPYVAVLRIRYEKDYHYVVVPHRDPHKREVLVVDYPAVTRWLPFETLCSVWDGEALLLSAQPFPDDLTRRPAVPWVLIGIALLTGAGAGVASAYLPRALRSKVVSLFIIAGMVIWPYLCAADATADEDVHWESESTVVTVSSASKETAHDIVPCGSTVVDDFTLANVTDNGLEIAAIRKTCPCTKYELSGTHIPARGSVNLKMFLTSPMPGLRTGGVYITLASDDKPIKISHKAFFSRDPAPYPICYTVTSVVGENPQPAVVHFYHTGQLPGSMLSPVRIRAWPEFLEEPQLVSDNTPSRIRLPRVTSMVVCVRPNLPVGKYAGVIGITFRKDDKDVQVEYPVGARIQSRYYCEPGAIILDENRDVCKLAIVDRASAGQSKTAQQITSSRPGLVQVAPNGGRLSVQLNRQEWAQLTEATSCTVTLLPEGESEPEGVKVLVLPPNPAQERRADIPRPAN